MYSTLVTSIIDEHLVDGNGSIRIGHKLNDAGVTKEGSINKTNITAEELKKYSEGAYSDFANGNNQTNKQRQNITMENLANEIAVVEEFMGNYTDILKTAIDGIKAILITGTIGKLGSALLGSGGTALGGTALGSFLGVAGPIALGIGAAAAGITAAITLNNKDINQKIQDKTDTASGYYNEAIAQKKSSGAAAASGLEGFSKNFSEENGSVDITAPTRLTKELAKNLGITKKWNKSSKEEVESALSEYSSKKDWYAYNKIKLGKELYKSSNVDGDILTILIAANLAR